MKNESTTKNIRPLFNVQILSALIWAAAIIGCRLVSGKQEVSTILIMAAGFHVLLMAKLANKKG